MPLSADFVIATYVCAILIGVLSTEIGLKKSVLIKDILKLLIL